VHLVGDRQAEVRVMQARRLIRLVLLSALCVLARPAFAGEYVLFYHNDALGSPQAMTDINGNVVWRADYEPFGNLATITETLPNTREFIGKERDPETSLHYFGARYYDDGIGRFLSVDPALRLKIQFETLTCPQALNNYAYGGNNPYRFVDRDGRAFQILVPLGVAIAANLISPGTLETTSQSALQFGIETGILASGLGLSKLLRGSVSTSSALESKIAGNLATKSDARQILKGLDLPEAQAAAANRAIGRATTSSTIEIGRGEGESIVIRISRSGADGRQVIESTIRPDGTKTVVQRAFNEKGQLVHIDPKTPIE
jgi:RHS repeat-associated protein